MNVQKVVIKYPVSGDVDLGKIGAEFTKWIQNDAIPGTLIDVADYSHMYQGLGVILVAHEYIISLDRQDGIDGLKVVYRLDSEDSLADRVKAGDELVKKVFALLKEAGLNLELSETEVHVGVADRLSTSDDIHDQLFFAAKVSISAASECIEKSGEKELPGIKVKLG